MAGPISYENWKAANRGEDWERGSEIPLYSDAHIVGHITEGYGPYAFLNPIAIPRKGQPSLQPGVFLRLRLHHDEEPGHLLKEGKTDTSRYHAGGLDDEISALMSLLLGARFKPGGFTREFENGGDPLGRPLRAQMQSNPVWAEPHTGLVVPRAREKKALSDLKSLKLFVHLSETQANDLVKAARLYQDALWICESDPSLSWLLFVSAVEVAASSWREFDASPIERLEAWGPGPGLIELILERAGGDLVTSVAELLAEYVGSRRNQTDFLLRFCPDPPAVRPGEGGQHSWKDEELERSFKQVYDYRSKALHGGTPFPAPMSFQPIKAEGWEAGAEVPLGGAASTRGGVWVRKDTRILLHTYEYIVRGALIAWWKWMVEVADDD